MAGQRALAAQSGPESGDRPGGSTAHTFVFADLAGFTALTEAHGDEHAAGLVDDYVDLVRAALPAQGADLVKCIGDAVLLRFDVAATAVQTALEIVDGVRDRDAFPMVRVGMHTGPAVERSGDWLGSSVNLAARVASAAAGDEVLLTEETKAATGDGLAGVGLLARGRERFKHVRDPVRLHRAVHEDRTQAGRVLDPVCHMSIEPDRAAGSLVWEGREHHFCSLECASAFASDPAAYA